MSPWGILPSGFGRGTLYGGPLLGGWNDWKPVGKSEKTTDPKTSGNPKHREIRQIGQIDYSALILKKTENRKTLNFSLLRKHRKNGDWENQKH